ncbi:uncharacterized protein M6B38_328335 [Iris pallida]|uniref:Uncharacterized protein n=1 Tax=Iris pallida TaxID=29817 RepID=A0AAX6H5T1_IRIPA|nr:uncharacterized protein M6B38_328335 [Iris pallida]
MLPRLERAFVRMRPVRECASTRTRDHRSYLALCERSSGCDRPVDVPHLVHDREGASVDTCAMIMMKCREDLRPRPIHDPTTSKAR